ncbi:hypothetical protein CHS0354_011737 [Potamilus streckersoni]|uniref:Uncharacterized protein n=1 Tax=Potamilus streckersoni TaxID=2493646 RepID=A0AAE0VXL4_9BIVA|nr:hypothetical protein CHS0354_011737 [Potamilus streckersoni]
MVAKTHRTKNVLKAKVLTGLLKKAEKKKRKIKESENFRIIAILQSTVNRLEWELIHYSKDFLTNKDVASNNSVVDTDVIDLVQTGFTVESDMLGLDEFFIKLKSRPTV